MLVAAAEPAGEPALVWRAAERLGIGAEAAWPAADAGLLAIGERVMFRHPLVRSAVYRSASPADRRAAHQALADAVSPARHARAPLPRPGMVLGAQYISAITAPRSQNSRSALTTAVCMTGPTP
jgi:hypothetical protein